MQWKSSKTRIYLTRIVAALLLLNQLLVPNLWLEEGWLEATVEVLGILLLGIAAIGRTWSSLYISGRKTHDLVITGPYSITRNPLYLFSFLGALGIGFCSENVVTLSGLMMLFFFYYPVIIRNEEGNLTRTHGEPFLEYINKVPKFLPQFSLYSCPQTYIIDTTRVHKAMLNSFAFLCAYPVFEIIEILRQMGFLPA